MSAFFSYEGITYNLPVLWGRLSPTQRQAIESDTDLVLAPKRTQAALTRRGLTRKTGFGGIRRSDLARALSEWSMSKENLDSDGINP